MVECQLRARGISDERVLAAMVRVPRELFVPEELREPRVRRRGAPDRRRADDLAAVHGGAHLRGARAARRRARARRRHRLGYQAAVLAELAAEVHSIERIPALPTAPRERLAAAGYAGRVDVHVGDGSRGLPEHAPFAAIAVAAAAPSLPRPCTSSSTSAAASSSPSATGREQLLQLIVRTPEGPAVLRTAPCRFVPLSATGDYA